MYVVVPVGGWVGAGLRMAAEARAEDMAVRFNSERSERLQNMHRFTKEQARRPQIDGAAVCCRQAGTLMVTGCLAVGGGPPVVAGEGLRVGETREGGRDQDHRDLAGADRQAG